LLNTLSETPRPTVNDASKQHIAFELWLTEGGKDQFCDFYWQKYQLIIPAGQSVICGIAVGMDRALVMNMEFCRGEEGGSGGVFVE
jgi:hypothetical protein